MNIEGFIYKYEERPGDLSSVSCNKLNRFLSGKTEVRIMLVFNFLLGGTTVVLVVASTYSETICQRFEKKPADFVLDLVAAMIKGLYTFRVHFC